MELVNLCKAYEARRLAELTLPVVLPVTIVTGPLGSGKTTLLQRLLRNKRNLRIVSLINDLGRLNHDVQVLQHDGAARILDYHGGCLCCSNLQDQLRSDLWDLIQDAEAIDYLVIETSGASDPLSLVQMLDQKFGKLTRARLDSVVTVVDADCTQQSDSEAFQSQIKTADVIVVNKIDLATTERVQTFQHYLQKLNPVATIRTATYGNVPLIYLLDVDLPEAGGTSLTHETSSTDYITRAAKHQISTLRTPASRTVSSIKADLFTGQTEPQKSRGPAHASHLEADHLISFTFRSNSPLRLHRLQEFLLCHLPKSAIRLKGFISVSEFPSRRVMIQMSGRRRFQLRDEGTWDSTPCTQLIIISNDRDTFNEILVRQALEETCSPSQGIEEAEAARVAEHIRDLIRQDARIELVTPELQHYLGLEGVAEQWHSTRRLVCFILTGAPALGITASHLRLQHGVDLKAMGLALQERINCSHGAPVLIYALPDSRGTVLTFSVAGKVESNRSNKQGMLRMPVGYDYFERHWALIAEEANKVIAEHLGRLNLCKCGH